MNVTVLKHATRVVIGDSLLAAILLRLPIAAAVCMALALLFRAGLADDPAIASLGGAWLLAASAVALLAAVGWSALAYARAEARRRAAERTVAERDAYIAGERSRLDDQLEQHIAERIAELQAANEQLEAFSYSVAHDLRAPLRSITSFSQALQDDHADQLDSAGLEYLTHIHRAAQRMGHLIDDLLNFSRLTRSQLRRERVDLSALARAIVTRLRFMHPDRQVEAIIEDGLFAHADPRLLDVVLTNLLGNAWKFTGKRSDARVEFASVPGASPATYVIRDNGVGFDPALAGRLFGVFQRLHPAHEFEGTGIGLATVQRLIHRHGGKVWAEGAVGQGAALFFTLESAAG